MILAVFSVGGGGEEQGTTVADLRGVAAAAYMSCRAQAEQKMAAAFDETERTTTMYQSQNNQLQDVLKAVAAELKKEKDTSQTYYRKLGNVNVVLTLNRMVALKRAEMNQKLHAQLETANERLVEKGGTAITAEWTEDAVRKGFTHKLQHMADERQSIFEEKEILDERKLKYDGQVSALSEAQEQIVSLQQQIEDDAARLQSEHEAAMAQAKDEEAAKVAEKQAYIDRMVSDQQEVVNVAVQELKTEYRLRDIYDQHSGLTESCLRLAMPILTPMPPSRYDQKILGLEGERDDLKNVVDQLQTDIREWQEKYDAAQSYRAQLQRGHETEVKSLNEQIDHLEDLCTKSQAAQDEASRPFSSWNRSILTEIYLCHACSCQEILRTKTAGQAEAACQLAEADRKAAEAAADDAKIHSVTLSADVERLRAKLQVRTRPAPAEPARRPSVSVADR
jgi:hypothetical protein